MICHLVNLKYFFVHPVNSTKTQIGATAYSVAGKGGKMTVNEKSAWQPCHLIDTFHMVQSNNRPGFLPASALAVESYGGSEEGQGSFKSGGPPEMETLWIVQQGERS